MTLDQIKQTIWDKARKDVITVRVAADKAGVLLPIDSIKDAEAVLKAMEPKRKPPKPTLLIPDHERYIEANRAYVEREFPTWYKDGHWYKPDIPNTATANGLQQFICDYIIWKGGRATRISSAGRQLPNGKFIPGTTRKGSSDVSSTIAGKSVMWEIKVGKDKPSPAQLKEQARERKAGGEYFFTHNVEEFFNQYDTICKQNTIFD